MKRIIRGTTYSTETSSKVACWKRADVRHDTYLTRGGSLFAVLARIDASEPPQFLELDLKGLKTLLEGAGNNTVIVYDAATVEKARREEDTKDDSASGAIVFLRVPASLKQRLAKEAEKRGQSLNALALRCLERELEKPSIF